jgi:asparagine synthase (glutamine-hydrolysing)
MCGIAGQWTRTGCSDEELRRAVERMTATLVHRGPDDAGVWLDAASGMGLGFRRLSILDLTPSGHQPMESQDGRFVIAFNGEIYNFADLKIELARAGEVFRGSSDTEVILGAVSRWGAEAAIPRLWGMFAIALWDRAERRLLLARDRFGKKPLYYALHDRTVSFASELKALRAVWPGLSVDRAAVASYLRFGYVPAPSTIYSGVRKLPPGTFATVDVSGTFSVRSYWDGRAVAEAGLSSRTGRPDEREAARELDRLLRDAVTRRMVADVPVGAFLSGGVDSSLVVALMQALAPRPVKTFTLGFTDPDFDEAPAARAVAAHLGTEHTEFYVSPTDARNVIPSLPGTYDEPFGDASQIPTALVASLARRDVTVALTGDGGDEVFGGYVRHVWADRIWRSAGWWPAGLRRAAGGILAVARPTAVDRLYAMLEPGVPSGWRQVHAGEKLAKLAAMLHADSGDEAYERLVVAWPEGGLVIGAGGGAACDAGELPASATFAERMMLQDQMRYLPDDILVKVDRATMAVSLEARAPLLDHRLVEWVWRLPIGFRCRDGVGKWLLRQVLADYVPAALFDRPKTGFGIPVGAWLRGPLRPWAEALLDEGRLAREGFLLPATIRRVWTEHLSGRRDHSVRLWVVLMFQAWLERWR